MKIDSKDIVLTGVSASLYVVINVLQMVTFGNPTIYGPIQLRVADCLIALAALLGWPIVGGVAVGCLLTNAYYFIGTIDVIFGPLANLAAASLVFLLRKHRFFGCVAGSVTIGLVVGGYLGLFFPFPPPEMLSTLPPWLGMIVSLVASSLIAVTVVGYPLIVSLSRSGVIKPFESRGLKAKR